MLSAQYYGDAVGSPNTITAELTGAYATTSIGRVSLGVRGAAVTWGMNVDAVVMDDTTWTGPIPVAAPVVFEGWGIPL